MDFNLTQVAKCLFLVGLPASGKTTFIIDNNLSFSHSILSTDDIIQNFAKANSVTYNYVFNDLIKISNKIFEQNITDCVQRGLDIVIDRTNLSSGSRARILNRIHEVGKLATIKYDCKAVVFDKPETSEWLNRLASRKDKIIPENVLCSMERSYQLPTLSEGFTSIINAKDWK